MKNNINGFWAKNLMKLRLVLMGQQLRKMRFDDFLALFSWLFVGNSLFILAGTTTFISLCLVVVNSLPFQEKIVVWISDILTDSTGFQVKFEHAIVPRWRDGAIRMSNVSVLCTHETCINWLKKFSEKQGIPFDEQLAKNYTFWDLEIESIDITLSLWRLLEGRGLLKEAKLKGIRGTVDRKHIQWDNDWKPYKRVAQFGDFDLDSLEVEDVLVSIENPKYRPFSLSIFKAEMPRFRKQWMLYDIMTADSAVGMMDNCLFSIHRPQTKDYKQEELLSKKWSKIRHYKMNGLPIGHLNCQATGPFSWLTKGTIDIDMHVMIPNDSEPDIIEQLVQEIEIIRNRIESLDKYPEIDTTIDDSRGMFRKLFKLRRYGDQVFDKSSPEILIFAQVDINDLKASVPLAVPQISYMNNALIRPVVAFMNSNKTKITLNANARMSIDNFNGAWDIWSAGLADVLSEEIGRSILALAQNQTERTKRLKEIGIWSLSNISKSIMALIDTYRTGRGWNAYQGAL